MSPKPTLLGVSGGIGAGKSLVVRIFASLGVPTYDADSRARWLQEHTLREEIVRHFGLQAFTPAGKLNRPYLAQEVFGDEEKLKAMNNLVHPAVAEDFANWTRQHAEQPYLIKEAAIMFETGSYTAMDHTLLVTAPEELRLRRILQRDPHRTEKDVRRIMAQQMPDDKKAALASGVLVNDEGTALLPQVLHWHQRLAE